MKLIPVLAAAVILASCQTHAATAPSPRDSHELLTATLWVQTSAEYRAASEASYRWARKTLDEAVATPDWTAALEQTGALRGEPPAVIMDLDETVLDNVAFQAQLAKDRTVYSPALWSQWVAKADAKLTPGAADFIAYAQSKGVDVFFVTNRNQAEETATRANLAKLKVSVPADRDRVLVSGENGWTSDKSARRELIARTHRIVMLVGDDLGDFVSGNRAPPAERRALAERHKDRWGERWVMIPNPLYGSWDQALAARDLSDADALKARFGHLEGFK